MNASLLKTVKKTTKNGLGICSGCNIQLLRTTFKLTRTKSVKVVKIKAK